MRRFTSLTLLFAGIVEIITCIVLYILPAGRVAYWTDFHLWGLDKHQWGDLHLNTGVLLLVMAALHLYYNWSALLSYLKRRGTKRVLPGKETLAALLLTLFVALGTLYHLPPMQTVVAIGEFFSERANRTYGEPPYGHAELSSLRMLARKMDFDLDKSKKLLQEAGIEIEDASRPLLDIARLHDLTPQQVYAIIAPAAQREEGTFPESPPPGFGRKTLREICTTYGLSEKILIGKLAEAGITAAADQSVREAAAQNDLTPMALFEQLHDIIEQQMK